LIRGIPEPFDLLRGVFMYNLVLESSSVMSFLIGVVT
jgi:hypothetical protein